MSIAAFLDMRSTLAAIGIQLLLLAAAAGILVAKFCFKSWLYHTRFARH